MKQYVYVVSLIFIVHYVKAQKVTDNYLAFDHLSLFDIHVGVDSTRVTQYEYDDYVLQKTHYSYLDLQSFKKDHYIDEDEVFIKTDSLSKTFELHVGDTFSLSSHPDIVLEVIPNNMVKSHYSFDNDVPDAMRGCSLRLKKIQTESISVYLLLDCDGPGTTSLLFKNNDGQLYADAQELIWELDLPRVQKVFLKEIPKDFIERVTPQAGGLEVFEFEHKKGIKDIVFDAVFLPARYDDIQLRDVIVVKKDGYYGAFDYELNTLLDIENKIVEATSNSRSNVVFVDGNNLMGKMNVFGNTFYQEKIGKDIPLERDSSYKIQKEGDFFYLRSLELKGYKNQYLSQIASADLYENVFFESKSADYHYKFPYVLFASRKDGKGYDLFYYLAYNGPVYDLKKRIKDYKIVPGYSYYHRPEKWIILRNNNREYPFFGEEISEDRYMSVDTYFEGYYRFSLPNGRKGWVDLEGNEYFDDK